MMETISLIWDKSTPEEKKAIYHLLYLLLNHDTVDIKEKKLENYINEFNEDIKNNINYLSQEIIRLGLSQKSKISKEEK